MGISDSIIAAVILAGAVYLMYHSVWKKKGHCQGCSDGVCASGKVKRKM
ncbi:MAG: FeoB-associated Cys-rich membrane protein [Syntrophobacteraceae bacterium]|nr:FeoB-associated Cys-rich membrane protein [Syntrophobacteraceae bacterium]